MQIKCQLGGEDMKHWQYEVLKSLTWEHGVCVRLVIVVAYSVLLRKYIPYPIYQACLGRHSRITWSVCHKLGRMQSSPSPKRFKPDRWEGHSLAGTNLFISRTLIVCIILWFWKKKKKKPFLIFAFFIFLNDALLLGKWWDDIELYMLCIMDGLFYSSISPICASIRIFLYITAANTFLAVEGSSHSASREPESPSPIVRKERCSIGHYILDIIQRLRCWPITQNLSLHRLRQQCSSGTKSKLKYVFFLRRNKRL